MLRGIASAFLIVLCVSGSAFAKQFDPEDLVLRKLLIEAFQTVSPDQREAKLKEVLQKSPENYHALIKLGELEQERVGKPNLKANDYFLRAALAQPQRPEAYLSLAQAYYQTGYVPEANEYMMMALMGPDSRQTYESLCLEGQYYLDTSNYYAAVITYAQAALSPRSPWRGDGHLLRKLYQACALSEAPTFWVWKDDGAEAENVGNVYWIPYVFAQLLSDAYGLDDEKQYRELVKQLRVQSKRLREKIPKLSARGSDKLLNMVLYRMVMGALRHKVGEEEGIEGAIADRFKLTKGFYNFGICDNEKAREFEPNLNLYDVFIEASVPDPEKRKALLAKLDEIKKQGLEAVAHIKDPKQKGRALFQWLRENLIVKYDAVDGIRAEGVINDKKYLCLSGAIIYTLMARDAGLDANGVVIPGHAYSVLSDETGQKINVETTYPVRETAEQEAGFNAPEILTARRRADFRASPDMVGEVSPLDLVSYQFLNVAYNKLDDLTLNKYGTELKTILRKDLDYDRSTIDRFTKAWRDGMVSPGLQLGVMAKMAEGNPKYHAELSKAIDEVLANLGKARSFDPFNQLFQARIEGAAQLFTLLAINRPASAMIKRLKDQQEGRRNNLKNDVSQQVKEESESQGEADKKKEKEEKEKKVKEKEKRAKEKEKERAAGAGKAQETAEQAKPEAEKAEAKRAEEESEQVEAKSYDKEGDPDKATAKANTQKVAEQSSKEWAREKKTWLDSIKRLEKLVKTYPCSGRLRRTFAEHCNNVVSILAIAKHLNVELDEENKLNYEELIDELNRVKTEYFGRYPEIANPLSERMSKLL